MRAVDPDRADEDFTAYAALIFLAVALAVLGVILGLVAFAIDHWSAVPRSPAVLGADWTRRTGGRP